MSEVVCVPRRAAVLCLVSLAALVGCAGERKLVEATAPLIIVDIDTLRADHLGSYGYSRPTSPHLDAFAQEAVRFDWAIAQGPNTPPSQSTIFTGLYPSTHGRITEEVLTDEVETLAEILASEGYDTAAFVDGGLMAATYGLDQGFSVYHDAGGGIETLWPLADAWLSERVATDAAERTFLLIHTYDVHSPYEVTPEPFKSTFLREVEEKPSKKFRRRVTKHMSDRKTASFTPDAYRLTEPELAWAKALYDGGILHVDDWFGRFRQRLEALGIWDRAVIVVLSDHGDELEEHDAVYHDKLNTPVVRVPLLVRLPDAALGGTVVHEAVELTDVLPTLLSLYGIAIPPIVQGDDLVPLMKGEKSRVSVAISESPYRGRQRAITTAQHRLIVTERPRGVELYAYRSDPLELDELSAQHSELVQRLEEGIAGWEALVEATDLATGQIAVPDEKTLEQLRTLGYVD